MRLSAWRLCRASLGLQGLASALTILLLALGVATIVSVLLLRAELEDALTRDTRGVDAVVGAKGSAMQLVLSAVLHVDVPTGNIPLSEAERIAAHPMVAASYPLALGDSYAGARIVGTAHSYIDHYGGRLASGRLWDAPMEAVLGSAVAARTGLGVDARFAGSHGLTGAIARHEEWPYRVVGTLAPTDSVLDRLVLTDVASVWEIHEHQDDTENAARAREITALLVRYRSPIAAVTFPRQVNASSALQAASPAYELTRLFAFVGVGIDVFRAFAGVLLVAAALSIFAALYRTLEDQRYDLALMRSLGASRGRLLAHVLGQGLVLGVIGVIAGVAVGHLAAAGVAGWLRYYRDVPFTGAAWLIEEFVVAAVALALAALAALLPAWRAYRLDISAVLAGR